MFQGPDTNLSYTSLPEGKHNSNLSRQHLEITGAQNNLSAFPTNHINTQGREGDKDKPNAGESAIMEVAAYLNDFVLLQRNKNHQKNKQFYEHFLMRTIRSRLHSSVLPTSTIKFSKCVEQCVVVFQDCIKKGEELKILNLSQMY
jgi:hypothetical protein